MVIITIVLIISLCKDIIYQRNRLDKKSLIQQTSEKISHNKPLWVWLFIVFLSVPTATYCIVKSSITTNTAILEDSNGIRKIKIPFSEVSYENSEYIYTIFIKYSRWSQNWVNIIPDDRVDYIEVNGIRVSLESIDNSLLSNWETGFHFNMGEYLRNGENIIKIKVTNSGGLTGLKFLTSFKDFKKDFLILIMIFPFLCFCYYVLDYFDLNKSIIFLIIAGLIIRLIYLLVTPYFVRGHDTLGHIEYIEYILNNLSIPKSDQGWQFYHPPLYYILSAAICKVMGLGAILPKTYIYTSLQVFSLITSFCFTLVSVIILKQLNQTMNFISTKKSLNSHHKTTIKLESAFKKDVTMFMIVILFVFWPSNIIHSVRIGNDSLLYLLYSLGLLFLLYWDRTEKDISFYLSALFGWLALITKLTGLIVLCLLGASLLYRLSSSEHKFSYVKKLFLFCILCLLGISINYRSKIVEVFSGEVRCAIVGNTKGLSSGLFVGNTIMNYINFDYKTFVDKPFADPWGDDCGRQLFLNYLFKTSLFGEFRFLGKYSSILGSIVSFISLLLFFWVAVGIFIGDKYLIKNNFIIIFNLLMLFFAILFLRISVPASCSCDFRYIMPALISICFLVGASFMQYRRRQLVVLEFLGYGIVGLFALFSIVFFIDVFIAY
jgi:hypothetical protein